MLLKIDCNDISLEQLISNHAANIALLTTEVVQLPRPDRRLFQRNWANSQIDDSSELQFLRDLCVDDLRMTDGYCNQGVADQMALYTEAVSKVPQTA